MNDKKYKKIYPNTEEDTLLNYEETSLYLDKIKRGYGFPIFVFISMLTGLLGTVYLYLLFDLPEEFPIRTMIAGFSIFTSVSFLNLINRLDAYENINQDVLWIFNQIRYLNIPLSDKADLIKFYDMNEIDILDKSRYKYMKEKAELKKLISEKKKENKINKKPNNMDIL